MYFGAGAYAHSLIGSPTTEYHLIVNDSTQIPATLVGGSWDTAGGSMTLSGHGLFVQQPSRSSEFSGYNVWGSLSLRYHEPENGSEIHLIVCGPASRDKQAGLWSLDDWAASGSAGSVGSLYFYRSLRSYTYLN